MKLFRTKNVKVITMLIVFAITGGVVYNTGVTKKSKAEESQKEKVTVNQEVVAENAMQDKQLEEKMLYDTYTKIPKEKINAYKEMTLEEVEEKEIDIMRSYEVGESFSEDDRDFMLYSTYEKKVDNELITKHHVTHKDKIKNSKTAHGVTASYDGYLESWIGRLNNKYGAVVNCNLSSSVKSARFKVYHASYGMLGTDVGSGGSVSIGKTYENHITSAKYTGSFSFNKFETYSAVLVAHTSTWGQLEVITSSGEFQVRTKTYKYKE